MNHNDEFIGKVESIYTSFADSTHRTKDESDMLNQTKDTFNAFRDITKDFFAKYGMSITTAFRVIRDGDYKYNKINCTDLDTVRAKYTDYYKGLSEFVSILTSFTQDDNTTDLSKISHGLELALEKDNTFIISLYDDKIDMGLADAVKQVECLVPLLNDIDVYIKECESICNTIRSGGDHMRELKVRGMYILCNSVIHNTIIGIKSIFSTYYMINESMNAPTPAYVKPEEPKFKLF